MTGPGEEPETGVSDAGVVSDPRVADGGVSDPGVADGGVSNPGVADGAVSDPGVADSAVADAGDEDPEILDAEVRRPGVWALNVLLVVAAILFAWDVYAAIGNLVQVPAQFDAYRDFVTKGGAPELAKATPWAALVAALVVPVVGYLAALRLGRGRRLRSRVIVFAIAYAAVSALTVSLTAYVFQVSSI